MITGEPRSKVDRIWETMLRSSTQAAVLFALLAVLIAASGCGGSNSAEPAISPPPLLQGVRTVSYGGVPVQVVIDRPPGPAADLLLIFHGTVWFDDRIVAAAQHAQERFRRLLDRDDVVVVSVAYPQQDREIGEGLREAEAALLWAKHEAAGALGIAVNRIFLAGHSQGGYVVTRLNTLHATDGVIANAPGPLDLEFRCLLEERGNAPGSPECGLMAQRHGPPSLYPQPYRERSLLSFAENFKADVLFVQGLDDSPIQMRSWPLFREAVQACADCQESVFLEIAGAGHDALFFSAEAREVFNLFID